MGDVAREVPNSTTPQPDQNVEKKLIEFNVKGLVRWFNPIRGYGFAARRDNQQDIFLHKSAIVGWDRSNFVRALAPEERIEFDVAASDRGIEAVNVRGPGGRLCKGVEREAVYGGYRGNRGHFFEQFDHFYPPQSYRASRYSDYVYDYGYDYGALENMRDMHDALPYWNPVPSKQKRAINGGTNRQNAVVVYNGERRAQQKNAMPNNGGRSRAAFRSYGAYQSYPPRPIFYDRSNELYREAQVYSRRLGRFYRRNRRKQLNNGVVSSEVSPQKPNAANGTASSSQARKAPRNKRRQQRKGRKINEVEENKENVTEPKEKTPDDEVNTSGIVNGLEGDKASPGAAEKAT